MDQAKKAKIALISQVGGGNIGDDAIWVSTLSHIKARIPQVEFEAFVWRPSDIRHRYGLPAFDLLWQDPQHQAAENEIDTGDDEDETLDDHSEPSGPGLRRWLADKMLGLRKSYWYLSGVWQDQKHHDELIRELKDFDYVVVVGGGQFDSLWGGPLKHPLCLWRWAKSCHRHGVPFLVLSVGAQELRPPAKTLIRGVIANADYVSIRDRVSYQRIGGSHSSKIRFVPDLAYAYPLESIPGLPSGNSRTVTVGLSPMIYSDPRFYPTSKPGVYQNHLQSMAEFGCRLIQQGHRVVLFASDKPDRTAQAELQDLILSRLPPDRVQHLNHLDIDCVDDLMKRLAEIDVVIAARLHGVLLAHVMQRPAFAIAHDLKVVTLMQDAGHQQYCQNLETLDIELAWQQIETMIQQRHALFENLAGSSLENRRRVEAQFDQLFGPELSHKDTLPQPGTIQNA